MSCRMRIGWLSCQRLQLLVSWWELTRKVAVTSYRVVAVVDIWNAAQQPATGLISITVIACSCRYVLLLVKNLGFSNCVVHSVS